MTQKDLLQAELNAFYERALAEIKPLLDKRQTDELSAPLLVSISDAYLNAPVRIMFVGKETNKWCGRLTQFYEEDRGLDRLMRRYRDHLGRRTWKSPFMQTLSRTAKELAGGQEEAILYTNLMKMDWGKGGKRFARNSKRHSVALSKLSRDMFRFEVELLKPDVIIFASGVTYDSVIKGMFPDEERSGSVRIEAKALWRFNLGSTVCYRTRHPSAIARKGGPFAKTGTYYSTIIASVKEQFPHVYAAKGSCFNIAGFPAEGLDERLRIPGCTLTDGDKPREMSGTQAEGVPADFREGVMPP